MDQLYTFIWLIVTLLFIGFFAGYEIAFLSANRLSIELKKKQGRSGGIIVGKFSICCLRSLIAGLPASLLSRHSMERLLARLYQPNYQILFRQ